jgi:hypothetical protein
MGMTNEQLKFVAEHMMFCRKHGYKKYRVLIGADSNDNGKRLSTILMDSYGASDVADYSGGYRDFSLVFDSVARRDQVVKNINANVNAYRDSHPEVVYTYTPSTQGTDPATDDEVKKSTNWTTYLIIGAAAVAIFLLLWDRKKK